MKLPFNKVNQFIPNWSSKQSVSNE